MRRVRGIATAAAMVAVMAVGPSAGTAEATIHTHQQERCVGDLVRRCGWINYDDVTNRIRGYAAAMNGNAGPGAYTAAVGNIKIQLAPAPNGPWTDSPATVGNGLGLSAYDEGHTGLLGCFRRQYVRVKYDWVAKNWLDVIPHYGGTEFSHPFFVC